MAATYKVTKIEDGRVTVSFTFDDLPPYTKAIGGLPHDDPAALQAAVIALGQSYWRGKQVEAAAKVASSVPVKLRSPAVFDPTYVAPPPEEPKPDKANPEEVPA